MSKCEHDKERTRCKLCRNEGTGGGSICDHGIVRGTCSVCAPEKVFAMYEYRARQRKLVFRLTLKEFCELLQKCCAYCGERERIGIDRIANSKGYTLENSISCCGPCNFLKRTMGQREFLALVHKIEEYQQLKAKEAKEPKKPSSEIPRTEPEPSTTVPSPQPNQPHIRDSNIPEAAARFLNGI